MIRMVAADGVTVSRAYANAYEADHRMEGLRIEIAIGSDSRLVARIYPGDEAAATKWPCADVERMLVLMAEAALRGDIDICDDREVATWIVVS